MSKVRHISRYLFNYFSYNKFFRIFQNELFEMRTFHEVVDEIYYKVDHLEPWAAGSRKTAGRSSTGMCGGVRGVSAGGVVSSAFCLLYKLYTLKLTKKQVCNELHLWSLTISLMPGIMSD